MNSEEVDSGVGFGGGSSGSSGKEMRNRARTL